jgi:hypothetical protein
MHGWETDSNEKLIKRFNKKLKLFDINYWSNLIGVLRQKSEKRPIADSILSIINFIINVRLYFITKK